MSLQRHIEIGFQVYAVEGGEVFGAVRGYTPNTNRLVIYIENAGDFVVPMEAIDRVHDGKVLLNVKRLDARLRAAIAHAHDRRSRVPNLRRATKVTVKVAYPVHSQGGPRCW